MVCLSLYKLHLADGLSCMCAWCLDLSVLSFVHFLPDGGQLCWAFSCSGTGSLPLVFINVYVFYIIWKKTVSFAICLLYR